MQKGSLNRAEIIGRLGSRPEIKYTPAQLAVTNISIATTESVKKGDQYESKTDWHKVVVFGKKAEYLCNFADKGSLIFIDGRLQTRSWTDRDDIKHSVTEIVANTVTLLSAGRPKQENSEASPSDGSSPGSDPLNGDDDSEPLPF